jgi:hypothetical protein
MALLLCYDKDSIATKRVICKVKTDVKSIVGDL